MSRLNFWNAIVIDIFKKCFLGFILLLYFFERQLKSLSVDQIVEQFPSSILVYNRVSQLLPVAHRATTCILFLWETV